MKVKCVTVVRRTSEGTIGYTEQTDHELHFYLGNDMHQVVWLIVPGPPVFQTGKTYELSEIPIKGDV